MSSDRIAIDPNVCLGEPHVKGTERPVSLIVQLTEAGMSSDEIVAAYSELTTEDVEAALAYAGQA
ncbi:MAG: DUF433 domain-containing protein [Anaerolineales bacterium]|nr:MAG: DUF433 domain-containing protein [Anaerolineales bacterium]